MENPALSPTTISLASVNGAPELSNPTWRALTAVWENTLRVSNGVNPRARMTDLRKIIRRTPIAQAQTIISLRCAPQQIRRLDFRYGSEADMTGVNFRCLL